MGQLWQDARHALKVLLHHRSASIASILCLAIGIGVNATMFAGADPWLFRPLPYREPNRLAALREVPPRGSTVLASVASFLEWKEQARSFEAMGAFVRREHNLATEAEPERVPGAAISAGLFPLLGVRPSIGRAFTADEDRPGGPRVCLVGHEFWQSRLGAEAGAVGRTLRIDDEVFTIVGVMPPGWKFPEVADLWTPLALDPADRTRGPRPLDVIARLAPGVSLAQADREILALAGRAASQYPETNEGWGARVIALPAVLTPPGIRTALLLMLGATALVLLIACANVANLLLAQAVDRQREIATRLALGASPMHLVRQLLVESLLLSLVGGAIGVPLGIWGTALLRSAIPIRSPFWATMVVGPRVLLMALVGSVLAAFVFGLAPALQAARLDVRTSLQEGGRGSAGGRRARQLGDRVVAAELAVSIMLLSGAALLVQSFWQRQKTDPGFDVGNALSARVSLSGPRYREAASRMVFLDETVRRLRSLPRVESAAAVRSLPFSDELGGGWAATPFEIEGRPVPSAERPNAVLQSGTAGCLEALGIAITDGRTFLESEGAENAAVVVVSQGLARESWPGIDPLGRRLRTAGGPWLRVVGVAQEVSEPSSILGFDFKPRWQIYVPYARDPAQAMTLVVRGPRPEALARLVMREVHALDPSLPLQAVRTMEESRRRADWVASLWGQLLFWAAAAGALMAAIGVYGVVARGVARRTQEIGVRMALGADPHAVVRLVLGQGLRLALWGMAIGVLGSIILTRSLAPLLYGVSPTDPLTIAGSAFLLVGVALVASYAPAVRGSRVDPLVALRSE